MRARNMKKADLENQTSGADGGSGSTADHERRSAAAPGITGTSFNLAASASYLTQPDGAMCTRGDTVAAMGAATGPRARLHYSVLQLMQIPGPTMIVNKVDSITVTLTNSLPAAAGNTSILFPGFQVSTTDPSNSAVQTGVQDF